MASQSINIRNLFVPKPNWVFVDCDWAQVENRIGAILANETFLLEAFANDEDLYKKVYGQMKGKKLDEISKSERQTGKKLVLGNNYGMTRVGMAEELGCTEKEAQYWIDLYWEAHPMTRKAQAVLLEKSKQTGDVRTVFGRRRKIANINSENRGEKSSAERKIWNTLVSGTAADILKMSIIRLQKLIDHSKKEIEMTMPIHDEILVQCNVLTTDPYEVAEIMKIAMEVELRGNKLPVCPEYGWRFGTLTKKIEELAETAPTEELKKKILESKYFQLKKKEEPKKEEPKQQVEIITVANPINAIQNANDEIRMKERDFQLPAIKVEIERPQDVSMKIAYEIAQHKSENGYYLYIVQNKEVYKYPNRVKSEIVGVFKNHALKTTLIT